MSAAQAPAGGDATPEPRKPATIFDVAAEAGVSKSTVSNVVRGVAEVSPATRERVLAAIAQLDYRPNAIARQFVQQRTTILGVLLGDLSNPYYAQMAQVVERAAFRFGYTTMFCNIEGADDIASCRGRRSARPPRGGHCVSRFCAPALAFERVAAARRCPDRVSRAERVVGRLGRVRRTPPGAGSRPSICSDSAIGVSPTCARRWSSAAEIAPGMPAIAPRCGPPALQPLPAFAWSPGADTLTVARREMGFVAAVGADDAPTALFASNDIGAIALMEACESAGLSVPQDISVVGFDDIAIAGLHRLSLTTVAQPLDFQAERAVSLLLERIENPQIGPRHVRVATELRIRESTAALRSRAAQASRRPRPRRPAERRRQAGA